MKISKKREKRTRRHTRVRARVSGTAERPRLSVFRSHQHVWVQLIDDTTGKTIAAASDLEVKANVGSGAVAAAQKVGELLAKKAAEKQVAAAVFDRGGYQYHGLVRAVAEGARQGGLRL